MSDDFVSISDCVERMRVDLAAARQRIAELENEIAALRKGKE